jgi:tRNA-(ms[2]io[6]A)-hydroxylase
MLCLKQPTDPAWVAAALRNADDLLVDHAHCEMKAASNALSLAARHPGNLQIVVALTDLARDEIDHFQRVLTILSRRGVALGPPPVDEYVARLRRAVASLVRRGSVTQLVDHLLVGALIEARSCERFKLLAEATAADGELADCHSLWRELLTAEARHYRAFVDLATCAAGGERSSVVSRLEQLSEVEGALVSALARGAVAETSRATIHG